MCHVFTHVLVYSCCWHIVNAEELVYMRMYLHQ